MIKIDTNSDEIKAEQCYENAKQCFLYRDYNGAVEHLNSVIKLAPKSEEAYFARGMAKLFKEQYDSALSDFDLAIKFCPDVLNYKSRYGEPPPKDTFPINDKINFFRAVATLLLSDSDDIKQAFKYGLDIEKIFYLYFRAYLAFPTYD